MSVLPPSRLFPDQSEKLRFLVDHRSDQRERSKANPALARDASDGGDPRDRRSSIVTDQEGLATFLGATPPEVSRWCRGHARFPDRLLGELCRLYAIREEHFRTDSYVTFVTRYGDPATVGRIGTPVLSGLWRRLLQAASGHVEVLPSLPTDPIDAVGRNRLRYATARRSATDEALPEIAQGAAFWIRLVSPQRPDASLVWAGWHLVLLNHHLGVDGFRALLPRETNDPADWEPCLPVTGIVTLPRDAILRHEAPDLGEFGMVAVLTRDLLPSELLDALGRESAYGLALEPVLDELTAQVAPAMQRGRAALAMARYRVVTPDAGAADG